MEKALISEQLKKLQNTSPKKRYQQKMLRRFSGFPFNPDHKICWVYCFTEELCKGTTVYSLCDFAFEFAQIFVITDDLFCLLACNLYADETFKVLYYH
jgi:hypothetical protein